jgi:ZIP family zinc transporter
LHFLLTMKLFRLCVLACLGSLLIGLGHVALSSSGLPLLALPSVSSMAGAATASSLPTVSSEAIAVNGISGDPVTRSLTPSPLLAQADAASNGESATAETGFAALLQDVPIVVLGIVASLAAGLATGVGALPILFVGKISDAVQGSLLGFAAGVMLAATSFSLLIPCIERVTDNGGSQLYAAGVAVGGTLIGSGFIWLTDRTVPFQQFIAKPLVDFDAAKLRGIWLFIFAIAIHNFPEGLAVGVGFGGGNIGNGLALAIGIGLQNLPEGLAVALALSSQGYSKAKAFWVALLTGLLEPLGGLVGVGIITLGEALLPWGLAFAAGAMLFVIGDEVIPEAQYLEKGRLATVGIVSGFVIMMFLDVTLGG